MKIKKLLVLAIFTIAIVGIIAPMNAASINKNVKTESKAKTASYKITWNGNSGKIGSKSTVTTTVKKGSKIGTLPAPKRSGYTFKGWYTKKTGGTKITKNTVVKKKVTYYGQWKITLTSQEKKLLGSWHRYQFYSIYNYRVDMYIFKDNGKFIFQRGTVFYKTGDYKVSSGKITFTNVIETYANGTKISYPNTVAEYRFEKNSNGSQEDYLNIDYLEYPDKTYLPLDLGWARFTKSI